MTRELVKLVSVAVAGVAVLSAAESARLRIACVNADRMPTLVVPLDVERTSLGWPSLNPNDFSLREDGTKTSAADKIQTFRDAGMGLALIVALDASGSMAGRPMAAVQKGLAQLVSRKRSQDRVAVMSFADEARWESKWDSSDAATQDAFRNLQTRGNFTRLYDAVDQALSEFNRQADKDKTFPQRRCLLVISDGHDEGSQMKLAALLQHLSASRVRLDAVGLAHSRRWLGILRQMAYTGYGEFLTASTPEELTDRLGTGIDSLLDMPTLNFQAQHLEADGKRHEIGVMYAPTGSNEELAVNIPAVFWRSSRNIYIAAAVLGAIIAAFFLFRLRKPKNPAQPAVDRQKPATTLEPLPPPKRTATIVEPSAPDLRPQTAAAAAPAYGDPLTSLQMQPSMQPPARPAASVRVSTMLVPDTAGPLHLRVIAGPYSGQKFAVTEQEFWIGSAQNNHLCLSADQGISGNHFCIRREQTFYRLYDNGSLNSTFVNGRSISQEIAILRYGDRIRAGATDFLVEAASDA